MQTSPCYFNHFGYHELVWNTSCAVTLYVFDYPNWGNSTELVANFKMERVTPIDKKIAVSGNICKGWTIIIRLPKTGKVTYIWVLVCAVLALATFWIHPGSNARFIFGTTNLLILFLLMLEFRMSLPMAGAQMPLISQLN